MKKFLFLSFCLIGNMSGAFASTPAREVADPIVDFIDQHKNDLKIEKNKDERIIKIELDIDNDANIDVLLTYEKTCLRDIEYENSVYTWDTYRKLNNGRYKIIKWQKFRTPDGDQFLQGRIEFDPDMFYVGVVKEISAYGVVATLYLKKHNGVELSSYIVREDHFERFNYPDPKSPAVIYHRNDTNDIPDFPVAARSYLGKPSVSKVFVSPSVYKAADVSHGSDVIKQAATRTPENKTSGQDTIAIATQSKQKAALTTPLSIMAVLIVATFCLLRWLKNRRSKA